MDARDDVPVVAERTVEGPASVRARLPGIPTARPHATGVENEAVDAAQAGRHVEHPAGRGEGRVERGEQLRGGRHLRLAGVEIVEGARVLVAPDVARGSPAVFYVRLVAHDEEARQVAQLLRALDEARRPGGVLAGARRDGQQLVVVHADDVDQAVGLGRGRHGPHSAGVGARVAVAPARVEDHLDVVAALARGQREVEHAAVAAVPVHPRQRRSACGEAWVRGRAETTGRHDLPTLSDASRSSGGSSAEDSLRAVFPRVVRGLTDAAHWPVNASQPPDALRLACGSEH